MTTQNAFKRSKEMFAAIQVLTSTGLQGLNLQSAIQELGEYGSRGHGGKFHKRHANAHNFHSSKYQPHQGKQEIARRLRQAATNR